MRFSPYASALLGAVLVSGLFGGGHAVAADAAIPRGLPPSAMLLLRYDANHDGIVTREEMEAGLKADYEAADTNHDGCIDPAETRAENARRLKRDGEQASPIVDWNNDGCVDMNEFSSTARSYFTFVDKKKDGRVTLQELRGPSMPFAAPNDGKGNDDKKGAPDTDAGPGNSY